MNDLNYNQSGNARAGIIIFLILGVVGTIGIYYRHNIVPGEGYRYTVTLVESKCYTLVRGNGYALRYAAEGELIKTRCDPSELELQEGKKYLLRYAKANTKYYEVLNFELVDSVEVPAGGWSSIPGEHFRRIE